MQIIILNQFHYLLVLFQVREFYLQPLSSLTLVHALFEILKQIFPASLLIIITSTFIMICIFHFLLGVSSWILLVLLFLKEKDRCGLLQILIGSLLSLCSLLLLLILWIALINLYQILALAFV